MLYSQFFVDEDRYVISAKNIVEIVPCMPLKSVSMLPDYAAGIMNYHGAQLPVIDLCRLLINRPCKKILSTRIIIVEHASDDDMPMSLGYIVEKATEMLTIDEELFKPPAMNNPDSLVDGLVAINQGSLITQISIADVFSKLDDVFFQVADPSVSGIVK